MATDNQTLAPPLIQHLFRRLRDVGAEHAAAKHELETMKTELRRLDHLIGGRKHEERLETWETMARRLVAKHELETMSALNKKIEERKRRLDELGTMSELDNGIEDLKRRLAAGNDSRPTFHKGYDLKRMSYDLKRMTERREYRIAAEHELETLEAERHELDHKIEERKRRLSADHELETLKAGPHELIKERKHLHIKKMLPKQHQYEGAKKTLFSLRKGIDDAVIDYSKASYLSFSTQFYEKFPRELRDMCYEHLISSEIVEQIAEVVTYEANLAFSFSRNPLPRPSGAVHLIDTSFSHPVVAEEILQLAAARTDDLMQNTLYLKNVFYFPRLQAFHPFNLGVSAFDMAGRFDIGWHFVETATQLFRKRNKLKNRSVAHRVHDYLLYKPDQTARRVCEELLQIPPRKHQNLFYVIHISPGSEDFGKHLWLEDLEKQLKRALEQLGNPARLEFRLGYTMFGEYQLYGSDMR